MKRSKSKKPYALHFVKRNPANLKFEVDDKGEPVAGDKIKEVTIMESHANELNNIWENSGKIMVPIDPDVYYGVEDKEADDEDKERHPEIYAMKKDQLIEQLKAYELDTNGKVDELRKRLIDFIDN